jgi:radical SAM protein (TIGR01212 family)
MPRTYYPLSEYLKEQYGEKVYKLPISLPVTCPNRDGTLGTGGCLYCAPEGAGFETMRDTVPVAEQLARNMEYIGKKYNARLFIAYFQNYCNTYMPPDALFRTVLQAACPGVVEIHIATRPDCVSRNTAEILKKAGLETGRKICVELGLQSINAKTLDIIYRKHSPAEFIDACLSLHGAGIGVTAHVIADMPWDAPEDVAACAKVLSALRVEGVKLHSLYVPKGSALEKQVLTGETALLTEEDYVRRVIAFLSYLRPETVIHRLIGRIPEAFSVSANFDKSWWLIKEKIENVMEELGLYQGIACDYLDGSALRKKGYEKK